MHWFVLRTLLPSLFAVLACQAPRPNVLDELPAPRLMQVETRQESAHAQTLGPGSTAQIDWFAGRKKLGTLERRVRGELWVDEQDRVREANLQLEFAVEQAPARLPAGLAAEAQTLWLRWSAADEVAATDGAPSRATLTWNRRQGELPLQLRRRRGKSLAGEPRVLENLRPVPISLLDYGLRLDLSVEGTPSALTEARLTLHLQLPAPNPR